jgi:hypothetical protein
LKTFKVGNGDHDLVRSAAAAGFPRRGDYIIFHISVTISYSSSPALYHIHILAASADPPSTSYRMAFPRGLLPPGIITDTWTSVSDARSWSGLQSEPWRAVARNLGDPNLDSLFTVAGISIADLKYAISTATIGGNQISAIDKSLTNLTLNAIKAKFGIEPCDLLATDNPSQASSAVVGTLSGAAMPIRHKIKGSHVIDQGLDMEFEMLQAEVLLDARQQYVLQQGDAPVERDEVTDQQLSCLYGKIQLRLAPFVDMGVWGPYGDRLARAMKFMSQEFRDGKWSNVELQGASHMHAWDESWRIFRTAAIMLGLATPSTLDRYSLEFRERVREHPNCWHIAAQADIRCRSEFWTLELRKQEAFHAAQPQLSAFNAAQPWNSVIKASAVNTEFWHKEFDKLALNYKLSGGRALPAVPLLPEQVAAVEDKKQPKRKPTVDVSAQRKDGRFFRSINGSEICFDWSRTENGCSTTCPHHRAHVCEWCRQPHRTIACPVHPGWKPTELTAQKGKGKGKGRGKKRRSF